MTVDLVARPQIVSGRAIFGFVNSISAAVAYLVGGICCSVLQIAE